MNQNKMMSTTIGISGMGPGGEEVFLPVMVLSQKRLLWNIEAREGPTNGAEAF